MYCKMSKVLIILIKEKQTIMMLDCKLSKLWEGEHMIG